MALFIAGAAVVLYLQNNTFPLGVQPDEAKKVAFILQGDQDFMHPILMLQAARLANLGVDVRDPQQVVELGRTISALFGGIFVFATFLLGRAMLRDDILALIGALVVAIVPLTAISAQIVKEDIYVGAMALLALAALIRFAEAPTRGGALLLGVAAGLTASAKHVGLLVLILPLLTPLVCQLENSRRYWSTLPIAFATVLAVYVAVNFPALMAYERSYEGVTSEIEHVSHGHGSFVSPFQTYFVHYIREGFIKGLGLSLALSGVAGLLFAAWRWRTLETALRIPLLFAALWYFAHELVPLKPGVSRYMVALGPVVVIFAAFITRTLFAWQEFTRARAVGLARIAMLMMAATPARTTYSYLLAGDPDTSLTVFKFAEALEGTVFFDNGMPTSRASPVSLDKMAIRAKREGGTPGLSLLTEWNYVVTRNIKGKKATSDKAQLSALDQLYGALYSRGYVDIEHRAREYEFRNRRFRVVDLGGDDAAFLARAAKWSWPASVTVTFTPMSQNGKPGEPCRVHGPKRGDSPNCPGVTVAP